VSLRLPKLRLRLPKLRFANATDLLADDAGGWSNLGDWSSVTDSSGNAYASACRALAERVGHAAGISPDTRVLDLGCGAGASLALWRERFGARHSDAIEAQPAQAARASRLGSKVHVGFVSDVLPTIAARYDAIVSVDAAYHFGPLVPLVRALAGRLAPGGALAFTTLAHASNSSWLRRTALRAASIDPAACIPLPRLEGVLAAAGFSDSDITILDRGVLTGFADFVARRGRELPMVARVSPGWLKIALTARACRALVTNGAAHYVLVRATRAR